MRAIVPSLQAELVPLPPLAELETAWRDLESRADGTYFLSWSWIGTWLGLLPKDLRPHLVVVRHDDRLVGLAVACDRTVKRRLFRSRGRFLNSTGDVELDELTIEYNGILAERGLEAAVASAGLEALRQPPRWDEIDIPGCHGEDPLREVKAKGLRREEWRARAARHVDLDLVRAGGGDYLAQLDRGVRQKVRKSLRDFEAVGPVRFERASTPEQAAAFFEDLRRLHGLAWQSRGHEGSFSNAFFTRFHETLVRERFASGEIALQRLTAGDHVLGCLYSFDYRGCVYQYQSGFDLDASRGSGWRPGLVSHALAIGQALEQGRRRYDFLAGDQRYKEELGNAAGTMHWLRYQRPRLKLAIERGARSLVRRVKRKAK